MREDVQKWWEKAKRDLKAAEYNFNGRFFEEALFLSQRLIDFCKDLGPAYTYRRDPNLYDIMARTS